MVELQRIATTQIIYGIVGLQRTATAQIIVFMVRGATGYVTSNMNQLNKIDNV
jgi:hypothetical protein